MTKKFHNFAVAVTLNILYSYIQASCDGDLLFTSVDTSQPGSSHDQFVFVNSNLGMGCEMGLLGNYFMLGDSGYALRPWILTPFLNPNEPEQRRYVRKILTAVRRCLGWRLNKTALSDAIFIFPPEIKLKGHAYCTKIDVTIDVVLCFLN